MSLCSMRVDFFFPLLDELTAGGAAQGMFLPTALAAFSKCFYNRNMTFLKFSFGELHVNKILLKANCKRASCTMRGSFFSF